MKSIRENLPLVIINYFSTAILETGGHHGMAAFAFVASMIIGMKALLDAVKLAERRKQYLHIGIWGLK